MAGERATKMLILGSARTLFSEKGYDNTPVEEICALAGIAKGTFFYHFESKQSIVRYILAMHIGEYAQKISEQMDTFKDAISKAEYFLAAMVEHGCGAGECDTYFKEFEDEWYITVLMEERRKALLPLLIEVVEEGIDQGYFRVRYPQACAEIAFFGIDAYLHGTQADSEQARCGIREIAAKTLGIKETELAI